MTRHKLFRLGKACVGLGALAAPAPLITCALDGRAGASVLLPVVPLAAAITLLAAHGTNVAHCDACMTELFGEAASASMRYPLPADEANTNDLNQAA